MDKKSVMHVQSYCFASGVAGGGGGEGDSIVFYLRLLTHSVCQCGVK